MIKYTDYDGPPRGHAVIGGKLVPLDYEAARALALNAHLLSLGDPKRAAEMVAETRGSKLKPPTAPRATPPAESPRPDHR